MALGEAVVRLRGEIDDAVLAMGSFCRSMQQVTAEQIGVAAKETNRVLKESVTHVGDTSAAAVQQIDQAFAAFHDHAAAINASTAATADAMNRMLASLESATESIRRLDDGLNDLTHRERSK